MLFNLNSSYNKRKTRMSGAQLVQAQRGKKARMHIG